MVEAAADQRVVGDIELERVHATDPGDEGAELVRGNVEHPPALRAYRVQMGGGQMEERGAGTVMEFCGRVVFREVTCPRPSIRPSPKATR